MESKVILITGANTGLGYQIVRALYSAEDSSYTIILGGRSSQKVSDAIATLKQDLPSATSQLHPLQIDLESDESINKAFADVENKFHRVDALINNAGAQFDPAFAQGKLSMRENWTRAWDINTAGTHILTSTFAPLLLKSTDPRLLFITSGASTLGDHTNPKISVNRSPAAGWPKQDFAASAYRSAKCGLNMVMREWHRIFKEDGVKVWAISPGLLATGLAYGDPEKLRAVGAGDPAVAGAFIRTVLEGKRDADVGRVINEGGVQTW